MTTLTAPMLGPPIRTGRPPTPAEWSMSKNKDMTFELIAMFEDFLVQDKYAVIELYDAIAEGEGKQLPAEWFRQKAQRFETWFGEQWLKGKVR